LIDPTSGEIEVDGIDILKLNRRELDEIRRHKMSMVFQRFGLLPHKTVLENVGFGLQIQGVPERKRTKVAMDKIDLVGLTGFQHQYPEQLSGGMQQRVGLARALATDPDILLMDEAFSALDPLIRTEMQRQLLALQADMHKTIVFITHDLDEALRLGDQIGILNGGRLIQVGGPEEIILHPADDYVTAFVQDVNRAKVLRAKTIMIDAHQLDGADMHATEKVHEDAFLEDFLSDVLERRVVLTVVDHQGNPKGYITDKEVAAALSKGD
jgi:glycine betaine/proline transport system ATP-binding protein